MTQHYSNPSRESEPTALPDIETFQARIKTCPVCEDVYLDTEGDDGNSCCHGERYSIGQLAWWYWFCFPGCMPDSDPVGPFDSEDEALEDARYAG